MGCANKTMANYEQSGCMLPISSPVIQHHCLLIDDAHQCTKTHHNECLIRANKRTGMSMDDKVVQQVFISECQVSSHWQKDRNRNKGKPFN